MTRNQILSFLALMTVPACSDQGEAERFPGQCAQREALWSYVWDNQDHEASPPASEYPETCPTHHELNVIRCCSELDWNGNTVVDGPTYDSANDRCCYTTTTPIE